ncbi:hypothetical protein [Yersinia phage vB_YenS-P840]|nr:hypothetical protein [Yersinia phage vB_YenS-P840]
MLSLLIMVIMWRNNRLAVAKTGQYLSNSNF